MDDLDDGNKMEMHLNLKISLTIKKFNKLRIMEGTVEMVKD